jgi:hypothetical protein
VGAGLVAGCATATVARVDEPPKLVVYAPEDGASVAEISTLRGYVDDDWDDPATIDVALEIAGGVVTAVDVDTEGTFESDLVLGEGAHELTITATDSADGVTAVTRSITVSAAAEGPPAP